MFCPNCGKRIPIHTQYCPYCGAHVSSNSAIANNKAMLHQSNNQETTNNFQKHIHHKARKLLLAIFAVAIISGGYWGYMNSTMTVNLKHSMPNNTYSTQAVNSDTDKVSKVSNNSHSDLTFKPNNKLIFNNDSDIQDPHYRLHRHTLEIEGKVSDAPLNMTMYLNLNKVKHHDKDLYFKYNRINVTPSNFKARHTIDNPKVKQSFNSMVNKENQSFKKKLNGHHQLIRFRKK